MTPTAKLRFIERELPYPEVRTVRILQQWWEQQNSFDMITGQPIGEWRDVPLEDV